MKYLLTPLLGLMLALISFVVAPIGMLFAVWFIRWDDAPSLGSYPDDLTILDNMTIRGDLPKWLSWFQTPDERFPGGMYEPAVHAMLLSRGKIVTSWYWAGYRNQMMGMAAYFGRQTTDYIPELSNGFWERDSVWSYTIPLGPVKIVAGWQCYKTSIGTFIAVPVLTLKRK
jgi:hypothetical protein